MRIALVVHGFPPYERTGVENYTAGIARALARRGHTVEVFAPRRAPLLPEHSLRREQGDGFGVNWLTLNQEPEGPRAMLDRPGVASSFGQFLDSERPDVVHLQHIVKLGVGPIFEAFKRKIPTVYTAHDYYAVCHRYTLLRPDLSHCDVRADFMACGQCDAALGYLNQFEALGDYQMGVLDDQLKEEQKAGLAGLLADDAEAAGWEQGALDAATDLRRELDSLRLQAFGRLDLVLAPTRYLAAELIRGGVSSDRVEVLPYGVETADLRDIEPVLPAGQSTLRFAFFGGFSKHKGVHILLEAFGLLGDLRATPGNNPQAGERSASLSLFGYGSDEPYVERLRNMAQEVGASWGGSYDREELPRILANADVVVVPSIWVENQPLVIREAFASRRPVIASDFGAIPESVRHAVDGLLFRVGDAKELAASMRRCLVEQGLVARLAAGIESVHDATGQAAELEAIYKRLTLEAAKQESDAPQDSDTDAGVQLASVKGFEDRLRALQGESTRGLFDRALSGLGKLRRGLGAGDGDFEAQLARLLAGDPRARVLLRDARRESHWRREETEDVGREKSWLQGLVDQRDGEIKGAHDELEHKQLELRSRQEEAQWLKDEVKSREEEVAWLKEQVEAKAKELVQREEQVVWLEGKEQAQVEHVEWLQGNLEGLTGNLEDLQGKLVELQSKHDQLSQSIAELDELESTLRNAKSAGVRLDQLEDHFNSVRERIRSLAGPVASGGALANALLEAHTLLLFEELSPLSLRVDEMNSELGTASDSRGAVLENEPEDESGGQAAALLARVRDTSRISLELFRELALRREAMERALTESGKGVAKLFVGGTALGREIRTWTDLGALRDEAPDSTASPDSPDSPDSQDGVAPS